MFVFCHEFIWSLTFVLTKTNIASHEQTKKVKDKSTVEDVATAASGGSRFQRVLSSIRSVKHLARPKGYVGKGNNDDTLRSQKKRKRHNF